MAADLPTSAPTSGAKSKPVPGDAPIFDVRGLVKHYPIGGGLRLRRNAGFIQAVDGVDFAIHKGETLGLVGESGCGKTTVARTLMRLEEPSAGEALFHGEDIFRADAARSEEYPPADTDDLPGSLRVVESTHAGRADYR